VACSWLRACSRGMTWARLRALLIPGAWCPAATLMALLDADSRFRVLTSSNAAMRRARNAGVNPSRYETTPPKGAVGPVAAPCWRVLGWSRRAEVGAVPKPRDHRCATHSDWNIPERANMARLQEGPSAELVSESPSAPVRSLQPAPRREMRSPHLAGLAASQAERYNRPVIPS
jgi:hypothetical protein